MRVCRAIVIVLAAGSALNAAPPPQSAARARLMQARTALGGTEALEKIRALNLTITRSVRNNLFRPNTKDVEFVRYRDDVRILLPDHYVRRSAGARSPGTSDGWGFAGSTVIGRGGLTGRRETFGFLVFPLLLATDSVYPFVLKGLTGDTLRFEAPDRTEVLLDLDPATHRPQRIRYDWLVKDNVGKPTGERRPTVIEIADYRRVGPLLLPHKLTTFRRDIRQMEQQVESMQLNPPLTPADFR